MHFLRRLLSWQLRLTLILTATLVAYVMYAHWAWRDIPAAALDKKYGGPELRRAEVEGVSVRYRLEGQGPALVLVHSHFFDMSLWDAWLPELVPQFTVLRYDLPGHGLTGPDPAGIYNVRRDVDVLDGLLKQLGIDQVVIVGSSLGGNIAFTFAARHPQRTRALVLINSGGLKRHTRRGDGKGIPAWADHALPLVPPWALEKFLRWMMVDERALDEAHIERFADLWRREGNRSAEIARLRQYQASDTDALLAEITAPVLILWGEQNPQLPVELASQFEQKLRRATRVQRKTYPGAGHVLPWERPAETVADTLTFLLATP